MKSAIAICDVCLEPCVVVPWANFEVHSKCCDARVLHKNTELILKNPRRKESILKRLDREIKLLSEPWDSSEANKNRRLVLSYLERVKYGDKHEKQ